MTTFVSGFNKIVKIMSWLVLIIAGLLEVGFTFCLGKINEVTGNDVIMWYVLFAIFVTTSMALLLKAIEKIPLGTAYAIWTGIGAVGTVLIGIIFFNEPADFNRLFFVFTLIGSVIGLKFVSKEHH